MDYGQDVIKKNAKEHPNYFLCGLRDVDALVRKARQEADILLKDFKQYYSGDIKIIIGYKKHVCGYSITGTLTVNGKEVVTEDPCDLLFLQMNEMMLKRLLKIRRDW